MQYMDSAKFGDDLINHACNGGWARNIAGHSKRRDSVVGFQFFCEFGAAVLIEIDDDYMRTEFGEPPAKTLTENADSAGNDRGPSR